MMKRLLTALLCLTMCVMAASCSGGSDSESSSGAADSGVNSDISSDAEDSSSADDGSGDDSSAAYDESSEGDTSEDDDTGSDDEPEVDRSSAKSVCMAFLGALSDGDSDVASFYCTEYANIGQAPVGFKYSVSDTADEYVTGDGIKLTVIHCTYGEDGKIKSDPLYVTLSYADGEGFSVEGAVFGEYPTWLLSYLGVAQEDIPADGGEEASNENAMALYTMAQDVIADANMNGASINDGTYTMGDGSVLSRAIDANLEYQEIDAADYEIVISDGDVISVTVTLKDGNGESVLVD